MGKTTKEGERPIKQSIFKGSNIPPWLTNIFRRLTVVLMQTILQGHHRKIFIRSVGLLQLTGFTPQTCQLCKHSFIYHVWSLLKNILNITNIISKTLPYFSCNLKSNENILFAINKYFRIYYNKSLLLYACVTFFAPFALFDTILNIFKCITYSYDFNYKMLYCKKKQYTKI